MQARLPVATGRTDPDRLRTVGNLAQRLPRMFDVRQRLADGMLLVGLEPASDRISRLEGRTLNRRTLCHAAVGAFPDEGHLDERCRIRRPGAHRGALPNAISGHTQINSAGTN